MPHPLSADRPTTIKQLLAAALKDKPAADAGNQQFCIRADRQAVHFFAKGLKPEHALDPRVRAQLLQHQQSLLRNAMVNRIREVIPELDASACARVASDYLDEVLVVTAEGAAARSKLADLGDLIKLTKETELFLDRQTRYRASIRALAGSMGLPNGDGPDLRLWGNCMPRSPATAMLDVIFAQAFEKGQLDRCAYRHHLHVLGKLVHHSDPELVDKLVAGEQLGDNNDMLDALEALVPDHEDDDEDQQSTTLQFAFLESLMDELNHQEHPDPAVCRQIVRVFSYIPAESFAAAFLTRRAYEALQEARKAVKQDLMGKARRAVGVRMRNGRSPVIGLAMRVEEPFNALRRNMERYERYLRQGDRLAGAPCQFAVEITELLDGRLDPASRSIEGTLYDQLRLDCERDAEADENFRAHARDMGIADLLEEAGAPRTDRLIGPGWRCDLMQAALCVWPLSDDAEKASIVDFLARLAPWDGEHLYIEASTVREVAAVAAAHTCEKEIQRKCLHHNLACLAANAEDMEAALASELFGRLRGKVDLKDALPAWRAFNGLPQRPTILGTDTRARAQTGEDSVLLHMPAAAETKTAPAQPVPPTQPVPRAQPSPSASPRRDAEAAGPHALVPLHLHVQLAPNRNHDATPPTGREAWEAAKRRSEHHVPASLPWMPKWMQDLYSGRKGRMKQHGQAVAEHRKLLAARDKAAAAALRAPAH